MGHHRGDATSRITILSESVMVGKKCQPHDYHLAYEIDHWNIIEGMVTVYYKNGLIMEVTRINPKNEPEIVKLTMRHFYLSETDR